MSAPPWKIIGQGLAGTCLAWEFWKRGEPFVLIDRERGGSSRVAAGLINPITGKNFEPSVNIGGFLPEALKFYAEVERNIGKALWHPLPLLRLADTEKEWSRMLAKLTRPDVTPWLAHDGAPIAVDGWIGAIELTGGGRLDTRVFIDSSREFFHQLGCYQMAEVRTDTPGSRRIWCEGAVGLMLGRYGPHRCAKGEILTFKAAGWDETRIRIGAGGWLVPLGGGLFKVGSTYEWNQLDEIPTAAGRAGVHEIAARLGGGNFDKIAHEAGIRPILRRSEPLIGPLAGGDWMFNGLGSKGSLYAPGVARRLADWLIDEQEPAPELDFRHFRNDSSF